MSWHQERPVGFGLEETGTDPLEAQTATAAVVGAGAVR